MNSMIKNNQLYYNDIWKVLCFGIQAGLFNKPVDIPLDVDWKKVFIESKLQTITGIVHKGLRGYISRDIDAEWRKFDYFNISYFIKIVNEQGRFVDLLNKAHIPFVILKGTAVAIYYPVPELRIMGDIDFYVPPECFDQAKILLTNNQYVFVEKKNINDRHLALYKNGIRFEMHRRFSIEPISDYVDKCIEECMDKLHIGTIRNRNFPMLPPLENGLVLLSHLRKHLMAGIGLRQIIDWMMYVDSVLNDDYWESVFAKQASSLGLRTLAITMTRMCQMYLGLSDSIKWCAEADERVCVHLMDTIIQSGNFGFNNGGGTVVEKTFTKFQKKGFFSYLQEAGEYNWEAYHKFHLLKPFAWVYQIFRFTKQTLDTKRSFNQLVDDYKRSKERQKLLKDLGCF